MTISTDLGASFGASPSSRAPLEPVPLFRRGGWYRSLDRESPWSFSALEVCTAPALMVQSDLARLRRTVAESSAEDVVTRCHRLRRAVRLFGREEVRVGSFSSQSAAVFFEALAAIQGLPPKLSQSWAEQLVGIVDALTARAERAVSQPSGVRLVVLPSNTFSCLEACVEAALTASALVIRPSRQEPLAALRWVASLLAAGWPPETMALYLTGPEAVESMVRAANDTVLYGGEHAIEAYRDRPSVCVHGPKRACAVIEAGADDERTVAWLRPLLAGNGGRFCTNVHTLLAFGNAPQFGSRLAAELDRIPLDVDAGQVPWWPDAAGAKRLSDWLQERLRPGDRLLTRRALLVSEAGRVYLAPTLIALDDPRAHPLIGLEVPFPCAVLADVSQGTFEECAARVGSIQRYEA